MSLGVLLQQSYHQQGDHFTVPLPEHLLSHEVDGRLAGDGDDLEQLEASGVGAEQVVEVGAVALLDAFQGFLLPSMEAIGGDEQAAEGMVSPLVVVEPDPACDLPVSVGQVGELDLAGQLFLNGGGEGGPGRDCER